MTEVIQISERKKKLIEQALISVRTRLAERMSHLVKEVPRSDLQLIGLPYREKKQAIQNMIEKIEWGAEKSSRNFFDTGGDIIKSALIEYSKSLETLNEKIPIPEIKERQKEISELISHESLTTKRDDYFLSLLYQSKQKKQAEIEKPLVFICHHHADKELAGTIKQYLNQLEIEAFLAHENIKDEVDWNPEILLNLEKASHFFIIVTNNFFQSAYGNQEVGYAFKSNKETGAPTIHSFCFQERIPPGMLYTKQSKTIDEKNFHERIKEKLSQALAINTEKLKPIPMPPLVEPKDDTPTHVESLKTLTELLFNQAHANSLALNKVAGYDQLFTYDDESFRKLEEPLRPWLKQKGLLKTFEQAKQQLHLQNQLIQKNKYTMANIRALEEQLIPLKNA
jgi:hypothetical protein